MVGDTPEHGLRLSSRLSSAPATDTFVDDRFVEEPEDDDIDPPVPPPTASGSIPRRAIRRITRPSMIVELVTGCPVGEYVIQAQIGEGAMGTVYSAIHPVIGKTVAIKVLKPELCANQATIDRFVQEAQAVNRIGHPNIVDVFSLGELEDGRAYMVMEWLHGEDLKERLARGPLAVTDACDILDGIARALDAAHAKDVVHRDLKPDNVFLHRVDDGPMMVKLLDFGIAKLMRTQQRMERTQTGNMLGTPRYVSPEQARGINITHRSDIYSLGVMAYEMLAGRPPFHGDTAMDLVVKHLHHAPPPLSQFARVPKPLEQCVMRMLDKDPMKRPPLEVVRQILVDPNRRTAPFALQPRPSRWIVAAGAVGIAALAGVLITWKLIGDRGSADAPESVAPAAAPVVRAEPPKPAPPPPPVVKEEPPPPPAPVATPSTLRVSVTDMKGKALKNATIKVDGAPWGAIAKEIAQGAHVVSVTAPGRATVTERITIETGTTILPVALPVAEPVRAPVRSPTNVKRSQPKPPNDDDLLRPKGT